MPSLWWIGLGVVIGTAAMLVAGRILLRRAEARIRDAERRARRAERLAELGHMTGGLAHEIKNPLSTIGLNADLLAEGITDAEMPGEHKDRLLRRLEALAREAERLKGILSDFLQFAGGVKLDRQTRDVGRIVTELSDFFDAQCRQAGVVLRTQLPDRPAHVEVDEGLFKQALLNLMINATQAMSATTPSSEGPNGELMLRVDTDPNEAHVHVIDTGPGIAPQRLEEMFHPYVSGSSGGTGLGLSTARRIVEEHGGRLVAHSEPGKGSEFVIHLPLSRQTR